MAPKKSKPIIEYRIAGVILDKFHFNTLSKVFEPKHGAPLANYNIMPTIGFTIDKNEAFVSIGIIGTIKETGEEFINASCRFIFVVTNLKNLMENIDGKIHFKDKEVERALVPSLIGVSYSTTRGILLSRGAGTILQSEILPVVDPNIFLKPKEPK